MMFWAYLHTNGSIQVKRWLGDHRDYTDDCIGNPNVDFVIEPFESTNWNAAYEHAQDIILRLKRGYSIKTCKTEPDEIQIVYL